MRPYFVKSSHVRFGEYGLFEGLAINEIVLLYAPPYHARIVATRSVIGIQNTLRGWFTAGCNLL